MSELKRYFCTDSGMDDSPYGEFFKIDDVQATVQPLVDALEKVLPMFDSMNDDLLGGSSDWDANDRISMEAKEALAAYREATGEKA